MGLSKVNVPFGSPVVVVGVRGGVAVGVLVADIGRAVGGVVGVGVVVAVAVTTKTNGVGEDEIGVLVGAGVDEGDGVAVDVTVEVGVNAGTRVAVEVADDAAAASAIVEIGVLCEADDPKALVPHTARAIRPALRTPVIQKGRRAATCCTCSTNEDERIFPEKPASSPNGLVFLGEPSADDLWT